MNLKPISQNVNVIELENIEVLFSYKTPVAAFVSGKGYLKTDKFWSVTTSRHINQWLGGIKAKYMSQEYFDNLLAGVK